MSTISNPTDKKYLALLAETLPRVIQTEAENDRYIAVLEGLHDRDNLTPEEQQLSELLTLLIEDFEGKHYQLKSATPVEVILELMSANSLRQVDMVDVFGSKSIVSEVLSGKRDLSKSHIQKLSQLFHVSPELFL